MFQYQRRAISSFFLLCVLRHAWHITCVSNWNHFITGCQHEREQLVMRTKSTFLTTPTVEHIPSSFSFEPQAIIHPETMNPIIRVLTPPTGTNWDLSNAHQHETENKVVVRIFFDPWARATRSVHVDYSRYNTHSIESFQSIFMYIIFCNQSCHGCEDTGWRADPLIVLRLHLLYLRRGR